jgi:Xaa-Pro aminopeptidase
MDGATYRGDEHLAALLARAGVAMDPAELRELVRGVNAAPPGPEDWRVLVVPAKGGGDAAELREQLAALQRELAAQRAEDLALADRLPALRRQLAEEGLLGLVLPRTDEHGSEYLPASAERVGWLTGFTGSAGVVAVIGDRAALFVDGRYTAQARAEVDPGQIEVCHLTDHPPERWVAEHLPHGSRIGYDPVLHRKAGLERLRRAVARAGGELVALERNPVDVVWTARPPAPISPVRCHDVRFAGEASAAKRRRMGEAVARAGAEVAVVPEPDSIAWLLNIRGGDIPYNPLTLAYALLHADGRVELFLDPRKLPPGLALDEEVAPRPIGDFWARLEQLGVGGTAALVDPLVSNVALIEQLGRGGAVVVEADEPCILAKARKNATELDGARAAQRRDGAAMCRFLAWLEEAALSGAIDELQAAARLETERAKEEHYRGPSFPTISGAGPNGAIVHYRATPATNRPLEPGTLYLVDSGGQYLDATTDVTRTVAIGAPSPQMRRHFTFVLKGHIALARALFPVGTTGGQLDSFARRALWRHGLDFDHGTGHGVGSYLSVHEGPQRIAKQNAGVALEPGMILSNEPGYYRAGSYGIRTENLVVVIEHATPEDGERPLLAFEILTRVPIDRRLVEPSLLGPAERAWVDDYHARVRALLGPRLEGAARTWLERATAPLD